MSVPIIVFRLAGHRPLGGVSLAIRLTGGQGWVGIENLFWRPAARLKQQNPGSIRSRDSASPECARGDLNPHARRHRNLNPACLPISPLARGIQRLGRLMPASIVLVGEYNFRAA